MKKIILTVAMVIGMMTTTQAQEWLGKWTTVETTDDFGDNTGEKMNMIVVKGKFSNSATANERLYAQIGDHGNLIQIRLFEYEKPPAAQIGKKFSEGVIKVKLEDGTIREFNMKSYGELGICVKDAGPGNRNKRDIENFNEFASFIRDKTQTAKVFIDARSFGGYSGTYLFEFQTQ